MKITEYTCKQCGATRLHIVWPDTEEDRLCPQCRQTAKGKNKGKKHGRWIGGRVKQSGGYIYVHLEALPLDEQSLFKCMAGKTGYILEHRLVAARKLGRPLTSREIAHHKNNKRDDNRPENITVFTCIGDHIRHHAKLRAQTT